MRRVVVEVGRDGNQAVVRVRDNGPGFDEEGRRNLFRSFHSSKPQGLGLGLVISRSIMEAHGGSLEAERNDGPGAVFALRLPLRRVA